MATYTPAKRATAFIVYTSLVSQADTKLMKGTPTLAAGDFKVSLDGGALANLATLPTVTPAAGKMLKISLSSGEMTADNVTIVCSDAAGAEWCDQTINIATTARQFDDLAYPATSGRSMVVDASGLVDANTVKVGPTGSGTAQTARDVGGNVDATVSSRSTPTNITAATGVVLSGVTHTGAVIPTVTTTTTATNLTTNNDKTGYALSTAGILAIWHQLTSAVVTASTMGKLIVDNINAAITSRMATYTQPTGFLAATFPTGTVANTTNITAGTIATATNLTNAPTSGDLTATMKTSVENAVWDATMASHLTASTTGVTLNGAGSAGDPWGTALPGAYGSGTAGKIIGDNINATVSSRATPTNITAATGVVLSGVTHTGAVIPTVTTLTNLPAITSNWLTAAGIAATALNGKGDWNVGKTGYALTATTGLGNQTANLTGNVSGSVGSVTGLAASNLDATVSSRMATYTQPSGFLAATFPTGTVANTTNITAGTVSINAQVKKNTALSNVEFVITDNTNHAPKTSAASIVATRSIDGAAFSACANAVSELSNGIYTINLANTDLNGNVVTVRVTSTSNDDVFMTFLPYP